MDFQCIACCTCTPKGWLASLHTPKPKALFQHLETADLRVVVADNTFQLETIKWHGKQTSALPLAIYHRWLSVGVRKLNRQVAPSTR